MNAIENARNNQPKRGSPARVLKRWIAFNAVGALGVAVQLSVLAALTAWAGWHYLLATFVAVEFTVLHNFAWHEKWTWRERAARDVSGWWKRLVRFQFANGALSVGGNLVLMRVLVGIWEWNPTAANLASISLCSILNFLTGDRWVYAAARGAGPGAS